jgi:hypothetical protein
MFARGFCEYAKLTMTASFSWMRPVHWSDISIRPSFYEQMFISLAEQVDSSVGKECSLAARNRPFSLGAAGHWYPKTRFLSLVMMNAVPLCCGRSHPVVDSSFSFVAIASTPRCKQAEPTSATRIDCATRGRGSALGYRQDVWSASHYNRPIAALTRNCVTARLPRDFGDADLWRAAHKGPARSHDADHTRTGVCTAVRPCASAVVR